MFGNALRKVATETGCYAQIPRFLSLEMNPKFTAVSRALVSIAGLDYVVEMGMTMSRVSPASRKEQG